MKTTMMNCVMAAILAAPCFGGDRPSGEKFELINAGFENDFDGWMFSTSPDSKIFRMEKKGGAHEGRRAAVMDLGDTKEAAPADYAYLGRRDLPVEPGHYRLRFAMRTEMKGGIAGAYLMAQDSAGENLMSMAPGVGNVPIVTGTSGWREYDFSYRVPEGTEAVALQLQMSQALGKIWVDAVSVEAVDSSLDDEQAWINTQAAPSAMEYGASLLGEPCRNLSIFRTLLIRDPETKNHLLVGNSATSDKHGCAVFVDYDDKKTGIVRFPVGGGGWDIVQLDPGKLLFESLEPLFLVPVDIVGRRVIPEEMISVPVNLYAWRFAQAKDGSIYFGSYPTGHAYRYRPEDGKVEDLGRMGPEGNAYVRFVAMAGDRILLCSVMSEKPGVVAFDTSTNEQKWIDVAGDSPRMKEVDGMVYASIGGHLKEFHSETMSFRNVQLPAAEGVRWVEISDASEPGRILVVGNDGATYVLGKNLPPRKIWDLPLRGGSLAGLDDKDRVVGIRGQDYFVAAPLAQKIALNPMAKDPPPVAMHFISSDPLGGVTGGPSLGQTLFRFDPARDLAQNTSQVVDGNGEVYDGLWMGGKFYFVSYSGGDLGVWNPEEPWDQWNGINPQVLAKYNTEQHHSLIRPQGGVKVGPQGRLYAGWSATYGLPWGGLTEYDIASKTSRVWHSDIFGKEVSIGSIAADDKYVYGVTSNQLNGLVRPAKGLCFFVFDPAREEVVFQERLEADVRAPRVIRIPGTGHVWLATEQGMRRFDRSTMAVSELIAWPQGIPLPAPADSAAALGHRAWLGVGKVVVQLTDGPVPRLEALFSTAKGLQSLAVGSGQLFFTQNHELWSAPLREKSDEKP